MSNILKFKSKTKEKMEELPMMPKEGFKDLSEKANYLNFNFDTLYCLLSQKEPLMSLKSHEEVKETNSFEFLYTTNDVKLFNGMLLEISATLNNQSKLIHKLCVDQHGETIKLSKDNFHNITIKNKTTGEIYSWNDALSIGILSTPFYNRWQH